MKSIRTAVQCALLVMSIACAAAWAQPYKAEYIVSTASPEESPIGSIASEWSALVRERTAGRVNLKIVFGQSLPGGDISKVFSDLRQGAIDAQVDGNLSVASQVKELNLFALPFLFADYRSVQAVMDGPAGQHIFRQVQNAGVLPVAFGHHGFREFYNSARPIQRPEDLKGLRMRVVSPLITETFEALGAVPVHMSYQDLRSALAAGTVDGLDFPLPAFHQSKVYALGQKHATLSRYAYDGVVLMVSRQAWNSWTPADRQSVQAAALDAGLRSLDRAAGASRELLIRKMEAEGVKFTSLTPQQRDRFRKVTEKVFARWSAAIGHELVFKAIGTINAAR